MKKLIILLGITGATAVCAMIKRMKDEKREDFYDLAHRFDFDFDRYMNDADYEIPDELLEKIAREYKRCNKGKELFDEKF